MEKITKSSEIMASLIKDMYLFSTFYPEVQRIILRDIVLAKEKKLEVPEEREFIERMAGWMRLSTVPPKPHLVVKFLVDVSVELFSCIVKKYFEVKAAINKAKTKEGESFGAIISIECSRGGYANVLGQRGQPPELVEEDYLS
jgi:hypothetical protein